MLPRQPIHVIKELNQADRNARVQLVSIADKEYVLKTDTVREVAAQKFFNAQLKAHGLPALHVHSFAPLPANQVLFEYIKDSPTLGQHLTATDCHAWGVLVARMHAITNAEFIVLDDEGRQIAASWRSYIESYIRSALHRHRSRAHGLGDGLLRDVEELLLRLLDYEPTELSLTHGDLHGHNVLLKDGELILYDKFADFLFAPAIFDLGVVYAESFGAAAYPELGFSNTTQRKMFAAFLAGYGPLPARQQKWLDYFVLLRAFYRWPNRFAPHSGEVIRLLVNRLRSAA